MTSALLRLWTVALFCLSLCSMALSAPASPGEAELQDLASLKGRLHGLIAWESNRTGTWELYLMNADGTGARQLTRLAEVAKSTYKTYLRPRFSPDGKTILFAWGKHDNGTETWLVSLQGTDPRKLCDGLPLNWSADGTKIYVLRDSLVHAFDVATGQERLVSEVEVPVDGKSGGTVGMLHPSLGSLVLRSAKSNEYFVFSEGKTLKTTRGCEPQFSADGRHMYWVQGPKDFRVWDIGADTEQQMLGQPPTDPFNYTYFPTVTADGRWLLYGASPGQHDHFTSDYEVYLQELENWVPKGRPVRLTFNTATDRWPYLWVADRGNANLLAGPYDLAGDPPPDTPPAPRMLWSFTEEDGGPEFGGDWGLWPQQEGCRGTATFEPGADAEGGPGGAMRVAYEIAREPRSFSLWISRKAPLDLSAYDRLVLYARGDVPSLTLVVKDTSAGDPDAPQGIAECVVQGLTGQWLRFEVPFSSFKPRQVGGRVDWRAINHIGLAMIAPQNAGVGIFWVDNLRAEARP